MRSALTRNSRNMMMNTNHTFTRPCSSKISRAENTSSLSAMGSRNLPKSVTSPRLRAKSPSTLSVALRTRYKTKAAQARAPDVHAPPFAARPNDHSLTIMNSGMKTMRTQVTTLAGVQMLVISLPLALTAIFYSSTTSPMSS